MSKMKERAMELEDKKAPKKRGGSKPRGQRPFQGPSVRTPTGRDPDIEDILEQERFQKISPKGERHRQKILKEAREKAAEHKRWIAAWKKLTEKAAKRGVMLAPFGVVGEAAGAVLDVMDVAGLLVPSKKEAQSARKRDIRKQNKRLTAKRKRAMKEGAVGLPESPAESITTEE